MKRRVKRMIAWMFAIIMTFQVTTLDVSAMQMTNSATVYIKAASGDSYLYADGAEVKCGSFQEKNAMYLWSFTKKDDGSYWIKNMGTNSYMCLENANGTVKLESTIYEVWMSSKWLVEGDANSSTINNVWKSATNGTGGYIYANGSTVYYGTNEQRWVFEEYSATAGIVDDGYKGKLNNSVAADCVTVPATNSDLNSVGATMPYIRYDSETAAIGGGATLKTAKDWALDNVASQASAQSYVELPGNGAYAEWKMYSSGNGVVVRFTLPDTADGMGQDGSLDVYVNGTKVKTIDLTSYYMWQYLDGGASDTPGNGTACFAFDEVHFRLEESLQPGDTIRIQSTGANNLVYGVDFLEIEETGDAIPQPAGSYSVVDFGAVPDDGIDDYAAITACIETANANGKDVYLPAGTYHLNQMWRISAEDMMITGAGMWYTNIQFTNANKQSGGISGNGDGTTKNIEFCNMYINSNLRSRYGENAIYKAFMDVFDGESLIHDIWEEHFECGFWIADYNGSLDYSDGIMIANCRIRNNFADGVNFCQGTSNATVYNCNIRNCGDDGLAMWNNNHMNAKDESNNVFAYNTIELGWRAGGIAIYGGNGHKIYNNYIRDMFMASGIHLNTTFPGYKFDNTKSIQFDNNVIITSGCSWDTWRSEYGAIDVIGATKNVTFNNTYIYDAQHDGIRIGDQISNVVFNDLYIYGTGVDGQMPSYSSLPHKGAAIMAFGGTPSIAVNNLYLSNIANENTYYANNTDFHINKEVWVGGYQVPEYPAIGSLGTDHSGHITVPEIDPDQKPETPVEPEIPVEPEEPETPVEPEEPETPEEPEVPVEPEKPETPDVPYGNPDMVVTDIIWNPENATAGDAVIFSAVVQNVGTGVAAAGSINGIQFQVDGTCIAWDDTNTTQIMPGESVTLTATGGPSGNAAWTATQGSHNVMAWVNDVNRYAESNTNNNQYTETISVAVPEQDVTVPYGNPDLIVTDIQWNVANPKSGDAIVFTATIKNIGTGVAPAGSINGGQFQIDGVCVSWSDSNTTQIMPGESITITANGGPNSNAAWNATWGTHTVMAWINDINRFAEANTNNNQYSEQIAIY